MKSVRPLLHSISSGSVGTCLLRLVHHLLTVLSGGSQLTAVSPSTWCEDLYWTPLFSEFFRQTITLTLSGDRMDVFLKQKETTAPRGKPQIHRVNMSLQKEPKRKSALWNSNLPRCQ